MIDDESRISELQTGLLRAQSHQVAKTVGGATAGLAQKGQKEKPSFGNRGDSQGGL